MNAGSTPGAEPPDLSVVLMAYDEVACFDTTAAELLAALRQLGKSFELVVVDDGSRDGTGAAADALATANPEVRVLHHPVNLGLGGVYRTGFETARGDLVTFFPADGQFPASILADFVPQMAGLDLVLGVIPERKRPLPGRVLSFVERAAYRMLLGPMPPFQGVFMVRRELLARLPLRSRGRGWAVVMEMVLGARDAQARIESVPTPFRPRLSGASKVNNPRTILANLGQLLGLAAARALRRRW